MLKDRGVNATPRAVEGEIKETDQKSRDRKNGGASMFPSSQATSCKIAVGHSTAGTFLPFSKQDLKQVSSVSQSWPLCLRLPA